ncbi:MAG: hypothetical protein V3S43_06350 [Acidimicrobiia bacterium]
MAAPTDNWDENDPAGSQAVRLGDNRIRETKRQVRERLNNGGHKWINGALDVDEGKHQCGVQGTTDVLDLSIDAAAALNLEVRGPTAASNSSRIQAGDGIDGSAPYVFVADTLQGKRIHPVVVPLPTAVGRTAGLYYYNNTGFTITILEVDAYANTAPAATALDIDIHLHAIAWSDLSVLGTGTSINTTANPTISIAAGSRRAATPTTSFDDATLAIGEVLAFEIDTLSAADGIVLFLKVQRVDQ